MISRVHPSAQFFGTTKCFHDNLGTISIVWMSQYNQVLIVNYIEWVNYWVRYAYNVSKRTSAFAIRGRVNSTVGIKFELQDARELRLQNCSTAISEKVLRKPNR